MKELNISNGVYVEISYVLREDGPEGEELEVCPAEDPFGFTIGQDEVLPAFEAALMGKKGGDSGSPVLRAHQMKEASRAAATGQRQPLPCGSFSTPTYSRAELRPIRETGSALD